MKTLSLRRLTLRECSNLKDLVLVHWRRNKKYTFRVAKLPKAESSSKPALVIVPKNVISIQCTAAKAPTFNSLIQFRGARLRVKI